VLPFFIGNAFLGEKMDTHYKIVMYNKHKQVINTTDYIGSLTSAKTIFSILMYQTGVRYGQIMENIRGMLNKVHDDVIIHEGE